MNKVSGIILLVENIDNSVEFYEKLDFRVRKHVPGIATTVELDNFWVELLDKTKVVTEAYKLPKNVSINGAGAYLQINVSNVDTFYDRIRDKKILVLAAPQDYSWGHRECIVQDPDGYILCFYSTIASTKRT